MKKKKLILIVSAVVMTFSITTSKVNASSEKNPLSTITPVSEKKKNIDIRYYEQFFDQKSAKNYIIQEYNKELNFLINIFDNDGASIDNPQFQNFLMSDLNYDKLDNERLRELSGIIDIYENYEKNKEIEILKNELNSQTANTNSISNQNIIQNKLEILMPMSDNNDNIFEIMAKYNNGYNPTKAIEYAHKWANGFNTTKYAKYNGDCANFVSQCLFEGGMKAYYKDHWPIVGNIIQESKKNWYFYDENNGKHPSYTWTGASEFFEHWWKQRSATKTNTLSLFSVGDPVGCDWKGDGDINHMVIIDGKNGNTADTITYSGHTSARMNEPIKTLFNSQAGTKLYALKVDGALN